MNSHSLPALFLSHGSPMIALEPGAAGAFMQRLGQAIDATFGRPQAILAVSAHTLARAPVLLAAARHEAVYDFGGFDPRLNRISYDAAGHPALAQRAAQCLASAGIAVRAQRAAQCLASAGIAVRQVPQGGLDHGIWTALRYVYPDASVPVLPLAFVPDASPAQQFALGEALAPLRAEGVLVLGTGSITHNLQRVFAGGLRTPPDALETPEGPDTRAFRDWFVARSVARDWAALLDYRHRAPHAADMHPTDEHLLPWYVAAGAGGREAAPLRLHDSVTFGCLGMDAYAFGPEAAALAAALQPAREPLPIS